MPSFLGVYRAQFAYAAATPEELTIAENDLVYLLEKADDGWWTVKKRVPGAATAEPTGIVPHNFIAPAVPTQKARALYPYEQQNDEELSFSEGDQFDVYDQDGDWVLVSLGTSKHGFVPANYIQIESGVPPPTMNKSDASASAQINTPASASKTASAADLKSRWGAPPKRLDREVAESPAPTESSRPSASRQESTDDLPPPKPPRPETKTQEPTRESYREPKREQRQRSQSANEFHSWTVSEVEGRRKTRATLAMNAQHVMLTVDKSAQRRWEIRDLLSYSSEKRHVFLELDNPRASLHLRCDKDVGDEIIVTCGQLAGATRGGGGLDEILVAAKSAGQRSGRVAIDFQALNDKEVSVKEGENVFLLEEKNDDWWFVRTRSGKEGLVPAKFVDLLPSPSALAQQPSSSHGRERERSNRESRSRREQDREREAEREHGHEREREREREHGRERDRPRERERERSSDRHPSNLERKQSSHRDSRPKPDSRKLRVWTDRSNTFRVEAALIGTADGKIHLHKVNGVKIAVPASKLSNADISYVESVTGVSFEQDRPLVDRSRSKESTRQKPSASQSSHKEINKPTVREGEFDWFKFFLDAGVDLGSCQRYSLNFVRDNIDESVLPDITPVVLRNLGLREGDILRVTKLVSERYSKAPAKDEDDAWKPRDEPVMPARPQAQQSQPQQSTPLDQAVQPVPAPPPVQMQQTPVQTNQPISLQATGTMADLFKPLQPQKTAEQMLAEQQQDTQRKILEQQAALQKGQLELLKKQQDELMKQQQELLVVQQTGKSLSALGPFATGVAQNSTGVFGSAANPGLASTVLAMPVQRTGPLPQQTGPLASGPFVPLKPTPAPQTFTPFAPTAPQPMQMQMTSQIASVPRQTTGVFAQPVQGQPTGPFVIQQQPTGPFAQPVQNQFTGPFAQPVQNQFTGPFAQVIPSQPTGPLAQVQSQPTGPFAQPVQPAQPVMNGFAQPVQSQLTGPFSQPVRNQPTGPFASAQMPMQSYQPQQHAPATLQNQATGPFSVRPQTTQPQATGPFASTGNLNQGLSMNQLMQAKSPAPAPTQFGQTQSQPQLLQQQQQQQMFPVQGQATGPFAVQGQATGPFAVQGQATGPFAVQGQATGPFAVQGQPTGPFAAQGQPTSSFAQPSAFPPQPVQSSVFTPFVSSQPSAGVQPMNQHMFSSQPNLIQQSQAAPGPYAPLKSVPTGPFSVPASSQTTDPFASLRQQPLGQPSQPTAGVSPFAMNAMSQALPAQPMSSAPLQNQPTGFGFGNQPNRPNLASATASNPFGL